LGTQLDVVLRPGILETVEDLHFGHLAQPLRTALVADATELGEPAPA
jgi:hypothetical protein